MRVDALITLIGGGWDPAVQPSLYSPFLHAAGSDPVIACVVLDEGDGEREFQRWSSALTSTSACRPVPILVTLGRSFDLGALDGADGVLVCGGLTPAYADAIAPVADQFRAWLSDGRPYAGFSAGAAVAASAAVVGGWLLDGRPICPADAGEDLDELTLRPGLGLIEGSVDVHATQWGTLSRTLAAVANGYTSSALGIDENTALVVDAAGTGRVVGAGAVHRLTGSDGEVRVRPYLAGATLTV